MYEVISRETEGTFLPNPKIVCDRICEPRFYVS